MTFINVCVKEGKIKHAFLHWREVIKLLEGEEFNGRFKEFIFIDLDAKRIISNQSCFRIGKKEGFEVEEV
ncbi:hypothetical protein HN592_01840 [Candidatus Woesearchaeota archaeon]|jgi:hypothetical protein|nr:hypothetical protein [Candidatus Woesearchaeota archaeon]MBT4368576.1 hypothetical protein [Candidatus Woesearchaeota archaeon]MBT4713115.1 hypothetical protein [Candidatus Woesearchaeota archaeon]MBT6639037.1 hypothetical protein [Candidatus Woesearchaeota archaeon]MBT7134236.1 hypothetical protein [Candidatus Woesearchaeota archaeon]